ncbi:hypothetical protein DES53_109183 [Roseimicrobium gellanilyticum]|uniref:Uncharacterized protein n=1 Tax=Roseimicrobium gellanilyticum TaxID=748857 RepID=A0A366HBR8_9BACT|nr:hypothetical protein DES53_109183 [Roseimicrobium gellanilyticum]
MPGFDQTEPKAFQVSGYRFWMLPIVQIAEEKSVTALYSGSILFRQLNNGWS